MKSIKFIYTFLFIGSGLCEILNNTDTGHNGPEKFRIDYTYNIRAGGWYKVHPTPVNWYRARLICHYEGAELASPLNLDVATIKSILIGSDPKHNDYFSGLHQTFGDGVYTSIEGIPLEQLEIDWRRAEPDNAGQKERCLEFNRDVQFNDISCDNQRPYICFRNSSKGNDLTSCGTVDKGYVTGSKLRQMVQGLDHSNQSALTPQHCYKIHRHAYTWELANTICKTEGGYLAVINSEEEAVILDNFVGSIKEHVYSQYNDTFAIGFSEWQNDGWWTVLGQTLEETGFEKWGHGLPNISYPTNISSRIQSCGGLRKGELANIWCDVPYGFICEKTLESLTKLLPRPSSLVLPSSFYQNYRDRGPQW